MRELLLEQIQFSLTNCMGKNAIFFAERLFAHSPDAETLHVLATAHFRTNEIQTACALLQRYCIEAPSNNTYLSNANRYLLGLCYFHLSEYTKAEKMLHPPTTTARRKTALILKSPDPEANELDQVPNGACGLHLLGQIYIKLFQKERAVQCLKKSLEINPLLWVSYETLSELGEEFELNFNMPNTSNSTTNTNTTNIIKQHGPEGLDSPPMRPSTKFAAAKKKPNPFAAESPQVKKEKKEDRVLQNPETQRLVHREYNTTVLSPIYNAFQPQFSRLNMTPHSTPMEPKGTFKQSEPKPLLFDTTKKEVRKKEDVGPKKKLTLQTPSLTGSQHNFLKRTKSLQGGGNFTPFTPAPLSLSVEESQDLGSLEQSNDWQKLKDIMSIITRAYSYLERYECQKALNLFKSLDKSQLHSPWILSQIARAYYLLNNYKKSSEKFEQLYRHPGPHAYLSVYSTVLWHLQNQSKLAQIAHGAISRNRNNPEGWICLGNCFSLARDSTAARKFFERAAHLALENREFRIYSYAKVLTGMEILQCGEDPSQALSMFREALSHDDRNYLAWYGLGLVSHKEHRFESSHYNFKKALSIHPNSSVLYYHLALTLLSAQPRRLPEALRMLNRAYEIDPSNMMARFKIAVVKGQMGQLDEALYQLEILQNEAPHEAAITYAKGKVLQKMGKGELALREFVAALDLDSKSAMAIRTQIDRINIIDDDDQTFEYDL